jgi:hypothetical protein
MSRRTTSKRRRVRPLLLLLAMGAIVALCLSTGALALSTPVVYNSIPSPQPGNVPSEGGEAYSFAELGDQVEFSSSGGVVSSVDVLMSSWGCESGHWFDDTCQTTAGATFSHDITLSLYNVDPGDAVGSLIATKTQTFAVPYRPSADDTNCTGADAGKWFNGTTCFNGYATTITFDLSSTGVVLPAKVIASISFNTSHYGYNPIGEGAACYTSSGGCPYDSLNIGLDTASPTVGNDVLPDDAYLFGQNGGAYCDSGAGGIDVFRLDAGCWTGYTPAMRFTMIDGPIVLSTDAQPSGGKNGTSLTLHSHATDPRGLTDIYYNLFTQGGTFVCNLAHVSVSGSPTDYTDPGTAVAAPLPFAGLDTGVGGPCPAQGIDAGSYVLGANWIDSSGAQVGAPNNQDLANYPSDATFGPVVYAPASSVGVGLAPTSIPADGSSTSVATATVTDTNNQPVTGETVTFGSTDAGEQIGPTVDNGDGTYSATITASTTPGTPTITATDTSVSPNASGQAVLTQTSVTPTVSSVSPGTGPISGGTPITVTGTGFVSGATVVIGQGHGTSGAIAATNVQVVSPTQITATTGGNALPGTWKVFVTTTGGTSAASAGGQFAYVAGRPTVTSASPNTGPTTGGTPITITGTNFTPGATVVIGQGHGTTGAIAATNVHVVSSTQITATTGGGALPGTFSVFVTTNAAGTSASGPGSQFTYTAVRPTITSVSPGTGPRTGGTPITITGTGFVPGATVVIGQGHGTTGGIVATNVQVVSSTQITATTGGGAAVGTWNVFVTTTGGTSAISAGGQFHYS